VGEDGEEGQLGPMGLTGPQGATGTAGATGPAEPAIYLVGEDGADGEVGAPGTGVTSPNDIGPLFGLYAPGGFNVMTGRYAIMANHLILNGTQRVVVQGTGRLSIYN
jgi:hypothetical protein